jgi:hypothetical protein
MLTGRFCAFILLGPDPADLGRIADLADSLFTYEPNVIAVVIANDSACDGELAERISAPPGCRVAVLKNPLSRHDFPSLAPNDLMGYSWIYRNLSVNFVMKLDTDALVIAPFSETIEETFSAQPDVGMLGLLSNSCNRSRSSFHADHQLTEIVDTAMHLRATLAGDEAALRQSLDAWHPGRNGTIPGFMRFCERVAPLHDTGFLGEHCNGGAYALSSEMLERMAQRGLLFDSPLWTMFPFSEDRMMGLYCALVGLRPADFSNDGEPFGTQSSGLAFPPQELIDRGYSIVHSVKNDPDMGEDSVRRFFQMRRERLR